MAQAADSVKRVSLELGGNAPFIVFEDADLEKAAAALLGSGLRNAGQTCICADKVLVHDKVYDAFADLLLPRMQVRCTPRSCALHLQSTQQPLSSLVSLHSAKGLTFPGKVQEKRPHDEKITRTRGRKADLSPLCVSALLLRSG